MHKFREEEIEDLWYQKPEGCATSVFFNKKEFMNNAGSFYIFMQLGGGVKVKHASEGKWPAPPSSLFVFQPTTDLGPPITSLNYPRLIITEDEKPLSSPYVTLSHRWGKSNRVYLTKSTFKALQEGIDIAQLPQTFQDAIMVTKRRLCIRYLWIDTFCIFQDKDDMSDWTREAALMNLVYENAYCNLSATGAVDSTDGLFFNRRRYLLQDLELDLVCPRASRDTASTRYAISDVHYWDNELNQLPLHYRGWVLQERLLAPRVLHFCPNQLVWECAELDAAEAYPDGLPAILASKGKTKFKSLDPLTDGKRQRYAGARDSDSRFFAHELWHDIVGTYTKCALTNPGDKLVALSGIAKRMRAIIKDEYVVGMWRRYLASELLWYVSDHWKRDFLPTNRPVHYRAPSFSWTSVDGSINPGRLSDYSNLCSIEDIKIDYATEDTTGLVKGGYLIIKGTLKRLHLRSARKPGTYLMNINGRDIGNGMKTWLDVCKPDFNAENEARELFLTPIRGPLDGHSSWASPSLGGIVLQHQVDGVFSRLGIWSTDKAEEIEFIQAHHENEGSLPCLAYNSQDRTHTIKII
ncbi:MAG: hypothetical protein Q9188_002468 [Gyalolechia gomerana]